MFVLELSDDTGERDDMSYVDLDREKWESKRVVWKDLAMEVNNVKNQCHQLVMEKKYRQRSSPV